jgi:hypothetical protein
MTEVKIFPPDSSKAIYKTPHIYLTGTYLYIKCKKVHSLVSEGDDMIGITMILTPEGNEELLAISKAAQDE